MKKPAGTMFRPIDIHFARFVCRRAGCDDDRLFAAAALTSLAVGAGHICLELKIVARLDIAEAASRLVGGWSFSETAFAQGDTTWRARPLPGTAEWTAFLRSPRLMPVVGKGGPRPLVLDGERLYLHRYFHYELMLSQMLAEKASDDPDHSTGPGRGILKEGLQRLFPGETDGTGMFDWQRFAAFLAMRKNLLVISGGPGTGKTTTVSRILALLAERRRALHGRPDLCVLLAAPTGKAAARVSEAVKAAVEAGPLLPGGSQNPAALHTGDDIKSCLPRQALTLHRLLGTIRDSPYFRRNRENKIAADVVVVDEASMIPLPLMAKLLDALHVNTKLILLGDMNQLASVEPGYVLGDICEVGNIALFTRPCIEEYRSFGFSNPPDDKELYTDVGFSDCFVRLVYSHRFEHGGVIDRISRAINRTTCTDDARNVIDELDLASREKPDRITVWRYSSGGCAPPDELLEIIRRGYARFISETDPARALDALDSFRVLSALRMGPAGTRSLNRLIAAALSLAGRFGEEPVQYDHRPIIINRNDYSLGLWNGDIGVVLRDSEDAGNTRLRAWFRCQDGNVRSFPPAMLPAHSTGFAMTVHKAQGSEFDRVLCVFPPVDSPVLSRQLVYTAITRARRWAGLLLDVEFFMKMLLRSSRSHSGLRERLSAATRVAARINRPGGE